MEPLFIEHTKVTPRIILDEGKNVFSITGRSIPADATVFFLAADKWAEKFVQAFTGKSITFDIKLDHLNTGSVRSILSILSKLLKMQSRGVKVDVNWHYEADDDDIRDKGEEMSLILEHKFNYIPYTEFSF
ncbi:MAG TPA: DUF1987 domain-containing protein [Bacteroidia bacterium]|jgi:hypothetical protein|nr:DUF1987 domain-containing protein [Bacteroidia bacterium]